MVVRQTKNKKGFGTAGDRIVDTFYTKSDRSYQPSLSGGRTSLCC